jgi:hypothetical protein
MAVNIWSQEACTTHEILLRANQEVVKHRNIYRDMYEALFTLREAERRYYAHKRYWNREIREKRRKEMLLLRQATLSNLADAQLQLSKNSS